MIFRTFSLYKLFRVGFTHPFGRFLKLDSPLAFPVVSHRMPIPLPSSFPCKLLPMNWAPFYQMRKRAM